MTIKVKLFAVLRDRAGAGELEIDLPPGATAAAAAGAVADRFPAIRPHLRAVAFAVNRAYAPADTVLADGDELALLPPVSGG